MIDSLRNSATAEGFAMLGVAPAVESTGYSQLLQWIEQGYAGQMDYFQRRRDAYRHPSSILSSVRSILVLAYPYPATIPANVTVGQGKIARYVWGCHDENVHRDDRHPIVGCLDYHDVIHAKLKRLCRVINDAYPDSNSRGVIDTAPLLEREVAQRAGLGWQGKNTLLLNSKHGSYFFLACLLTDLELPYDEPKSTSHCGTCTACLDACPTAAFPQPGVLDASRCISYLTIEHRGPIDRELRSSMGDWVFGCDVCQEVCPWNRKPSRSQPFDSARVDMAMELRELFALDDASFRQRFKDTPLWRPRRRGLLRNAAIVLGNQASAESVDALRQGLDDDEPIVRGACAWALGRLGSRGSDRATAALKRRQAAERDAGVLQEIAWALDEASPSESHAHVVDGPNRDPRNVV